jgi:uncharacterized protein (TIRG00374 family)
VLVGFVVSATFAYFAVRGVRWAETWQALEDSQYVWLVPALALLVLAFLIRVVRWRSLFPASDRPAFGPAARALFAGYLGNNVLPLRAGEAVRIVALNRLSPVPMTTAAMTILVERAYDVLSLVILLFVIAPWLPHISWLRTAGILGIGLILAMFLAWLVVRSEGRALDLIVKPLRKLRFLPREALERAPRDLMAGLGGLLKVRMALVGFGWTTLSWLVLGVGYWLVMKAFDLGTPMLSGVLVVIAIGLAMILPSSPAALGVFEGATVVVLGVYNVADSDALAYALVLHVLSFAPFLVLAPLVLGGSAMRRWRAAPDRLVHP